MKKHISINKVTLQIIDTFIKFNHLIGPNIPQIVFDLVTY